MVQDVGAEVVQVNVGPAVIVVIGHRNPQPEGRAGDARLHRHVAESPTTQVLVQGVTWRGVVPNARQRRAVGEVNVGSGRPRRSRTWRRRPTIVSGVKCRPLLPSRCSNVIPHTPVTSRKRTGHSVSTEAARAQGFACAAGGRLLRSQPGPVVRRRRKGPTVTGAERHPTRGARRNQHARRCKRARGGQHSGLHSMRLLMRDEKLLHRRGKPAGVTSFGDHREPVNRYVSRERPRRRRSNGLRCNRHGYDSPGQSGVASPSGFDSRGRCGPRRSATSRPPRPAPAPTPSRLLLTPWSRMSSQWFLHPCSLSMFRRTGELAPQVEDHHVDVSVIVQVVEGDTLRGVLGHRAQAALHDTSMNFPCPLFHSSTL